MHIGAPIALNQQSTEKSAITQPPKRSIPGKEISRWRRVVCHGRQDADKSASSLERPQEDRRDSAMDSGHLFAGADLLISMLPLKKAPSPILMRCVITSPINELSLRISTRSLASMLPRTLPRTTTSRAEIFAATCASRLTVTLPPGRLIAPSTFPSMYNHSEPITSPLISRLLAIVAEPAAVGSAGEVREGLVVDASILAASEGGRSFFCSPMVVKTFVLNQHVLPSHIYRRMRPITYCFSLTCRIPCGTTRRHKATMQWPRSASMAMLRR
jgi:hypothetical protein